MKRADRRDRTERKYISRIKKVFRTGYWDWGWTMEGNKNRDWKVPLQEEDTVSFKNTPCGCSCDHCGNRRLWEGITFKEKRANAAYKTTIEELEGDLGWVLSAGWKPVGL